MSLKVWIKKEDFKQFIKEYNLLDKVRGGLLFYSGQKSVKNVIEIELPDSLELNKIESERFKEMCRLNDVIVKACKAILYGEDFGTAQDSEGEAEELPDLPKPKVMEGWSCVYWERKSHFGYCGSFEKEHCHNPHPACHKVKITVENVE